VSVAVCVAFCCSDMANALRSHLVLRPFYVAVRVAVCVAVCVAVRVAVRVAVCVAVCVAVSCQALWYFYGAAVLSRNITRPAMIGLLCSLDAMYCSVLQKKSQNLSQGRKQGRTKTYVMQCIAVCCSAL